MPCFAVWTQAISSKMITSEKTLTILFISQPDITSLFALNADFDQAPKKTKATAAITTVAQKTPILAITKS